MLRGLLQHPEAGQHVNQEVEVVAVAPRRQHAQAPGYPARLAGERVQEQRVLAWVEGAEVEAHLVDQVPRAGDHGVVAAEDPPVGQLHHGDPRDLGVHGGLERLQLGGVAEEGWPGDHLGLTGDDAAAVLVDAAASSIDRLTPLGRWEPPSRLSWIVAGATRRVAVT